MTKLKACQRCGDMSEIENELSTLRTNLKEAVEKIKKRKSECGIDIDGRYSTDILCANYALNILRSHHLIENEE